MDENETRSGDKFTLKHGQEVIVFQSSREGRTPLEKATVELEGSTRNRTIRLRCDGYNIVICLMS